MATVKEVIIRSNGKQYAGSRSKACKLLRKKDAYDLRRKITVDYVKHPKWSRGYGEGWTTMMTGLEFLQYHCSKGKRRR